jgi:hypothetical protein
VLETTIGSWCDERGCALHVTSLIDGVRFRITGQQEAVREAIRTVRMWIRIAA